MTVDINHESARSFFREALKKEIESNEFLVTQRIELQKLIVVLGELALGATLIQMYQTEIDCIDALSSPENLQP